MLKKCLFILLLPVSLVLASGFSIYEQGGRATGMAGAFIAKANDASSVFYNPAGISAARGWNIQLGTTVIQTEFAFTGPANMDPRFYTPAQKGQFFPGHLYLSYGLSPKWAFALGVYSPFGMGSEWGSSQDPWVGRLLATKTEFQTLFVTPVVAYRLFDNLALALGVSLVHSSVTMEKDVYFAPRDLFGHSKMTASANGTGFTIGLQYQVLRRVHLGVTYRSAVKNSFNDGSAEFTFPSTLNPTVNQEVAAYFPAKVGAKSELTLPATLGIGLAYDFTENLSMEFDYVQTGWHTYDQVKISFDEPVAGQNETINPRNYKDSYALRLGLEYRMDTHFTLRAGYAWDTHAVPAAYVEPSLPENDRHNYTIGLGYCNNGFRVDAAYHVLLQDDRQVKNSVYNFDGVYSGLANIFGLTVGYSF